MDEEKDKIVIKCQKCSKDYRLVHDPYDILEPNTLSISSCLSGGIYDVQAECPHCHFTVDLMG